MSMAEFLQQLDDKRFSKNEQKWFSDTDPDEVTKALRVVEAIKKKMKL